MKDQPKYGLKEPATYQIHIQGILGESWGDYFDGRVETTQADANQAPITTLHTPLMDQSALVGLISRLNGLGLRLLLVEQENVDDDLSSTPHADQ